MSKAFDLQTKKKPREIKQNKQSVQPSLLYTLLVILLLLLASGLIGYWSNSRKTNIISTNSDTGTISETQDELGDKLIEEYSNNQSTEQTETKNSSELNNDLFGPSTQNSASQVTPAEEKKDEENKANLKIKFYNGASTSTQATEIYNKLKDLGYTLGNMEKTKNRYFTSIIYYKEDKKVQAEMIKKDSGLGEIDIKQSTIVGEDDLWIVIGNK